MLNYSPASWRVPYDHMLYKDSKQVLVSHCLQFLLILILYPIPEEDRGPPPKNYFRHFLGRLHRLEDFRFIVDGMIKTLNQPVRSPARLNTNALIFPATSNVDLFTRESKTVQMGPGDDHALLGDFAMQSAISILRH